MTSVTNANRPARPGRFAPISDLVSVGRAVGVSVAEGSEALPDVLLHLGLVAPAVIGLGRIHQPGARRVREPAGSVNQERERQFALLGDLHRFGQRHLLDVGEVARECEGGSIVGPTVKR